MNKPNRLIKEKSPYLLQHAYNPVDWFPWCSEAFEKAMQEDKPVFLSIGYSTCHWCHVMEKESFEDENVARLMNDSFICIKVDREERPDIDNIYMTICQMMTGSGGWPLTIIMTPDKKPFFSGTYFPKEGRFGRIGMLELIPRIKDFWSSNREEIYKTTEEVLSALNNVNYKSDSKIDENLFHKAFNAFLSRFDNTFGGFGNAPKFPSPHNLLFLLRYWKRKKDARALSMVEKTLQQMRLGGIYDQAGFGFHRYSTDRNWLVPHFEKMLYDQALLIQLYAEAYQATKDNLYKSTAEEIIEYVLRDMTSPDGAFYSAEDADSEGIEGKFYLWQKDEIISLLGNEAGIFTKIFNIEDEGNWLEQHSDVKYGSNILHLKKDVAHLAIEFNLSEVELNAFINSALKKVFESREKRIHPFKDDKILTDWNGLMISALAKAAQVFNRSDYLAAAEKSMNFILANMIDTSGCLMHRFRMGEASVPGIVDDYSFTIASLIDLYEASFNIEYLKKALYFNSNMIGLFWDMKEGGFFFTGNQNEPILLRQKEIYDGAIPSGNSAAILNLLRLSRITSDTELENKANSIAQAFSNQLSASPEAFSYALCALDFAFGPSNEIIISGNPGESKQFIKELNKYYIPSKIIMLNSSDNEIQKIAPFTKNQKQINNKTTAYICRNYVCNLPVTSLVDFGKLLESI